MIVPLSMAPVKNLFCTVPELGLIVQVPTLALYSGIPDGEVGRLDNDI